MRVNWCKWLSKPNPCRLDEEGSTGHALSRIHRRASTDGAVYAPAFERKCQIWSVQVLGSFVFYVCVFPPRTLKDYCMKKQRLFLHGRFKSLLHCSAVGGRNAKDNTTMITPHEGASVNMEEIQLMRWWKF